MNRPRPEGINFHDDYRHHGRAAKSDCIGGGGSNAVNRMI